MGAVALAVAVLVSGPIGIMLGRVVWRLIRPPEVMSRPVPLATPIPADWEGHQETYSGPVGIADLGIEVVSLVDSLNLPRYVSLGVTPTLDPRLRASIGDRFPSSRGVSDHVVELMELILAPDEDPDVALARWSETAASFVRADSE